jgi:hypothetical protein
MENFSHIKNIQNELMNYAVLGLLDEVNRVYAENNEKLGFFGGWMLLGDIVTYSCQIMSIELLETIYTMNPKLDFTIKLDCNPDIFYNCILTNNMKFYNYLLSHNGPQYVLNKTINKLKIFAILNKRRKFIPILIQSSMKNNSETQETNIDTKNSNCDKYQGFSVKIAHIEYIMLFVMAIFFMVIVFIL